MLDYLAQQARLDQQDALGQTLGFATMAIIILIVVIIILTQRASRH